MFKHRIMPLMGLLLSSCLLSSCSSGWTPYAGIASGKNKSYAAPVSALTYAYEGIEGGSINGGCIGRMSTVNFDEIGKARFDGSGTCGAAFLPAKWKPGLTAHIYWTLVPYPDWHPKVIRGGGVRVDEKEEYLIFSYYEKNQATIPLPPPPPSMGDDFGQTAGITVHFLACNQIFITYGTFEEARDKANHYALFRKSQKLCRPRPIIKSMADYRKHKAEMDEIHEERKHIPQVILPEYMKQLEAEGKLPNQQPQVKQQ